MKRIPLIPMAVAILLAACSQEKKDSHLQLSSLFSDHMVVQREQPFHIWGKADAGAEVKVGATWSEGKKAVIANTFGNWSLDLVAPSAGGPFEIEITAGDSTLTLHDVLVGEVWLASGQSNMEMPLKGWPPRDTINFSAREIAEANNAQIRMLTVKKNMSFTELDDFSGSWEVCSSETASDFSATAYFFAKKLQQDLGVPVGIIHSSWGGTPAEAWTSQGGLSHMDDFKNVSFFPLNKKEREELNNWVEQFPSQKVTSTELASIDLGDQELKTLNYNDSAWKAMKLPVKWESGGLGQFDGVVWFRKVVTLKKGGEPATLSLGPVDDMDIAYVNGQEVGRTIGDGLWSKERMYEVPAGVLKEGKNLIAVKVMDLQGGGGLLGDASKLQLKTTGETVSLAGDWSYLPVAEYRAGIIYKFNGTHAAFSSRPAALGDLSPYSPTILYNAMIAPVIHYTFQGVIWYQGESNVGRAEQYEVLFPTMIHDWRSVAGRDFPFYFVQIAPFEYAGTQSGKSAALRDAQRKSLSLPNTGMAVTLDIGNPKNIHPSDKQDVGNRLALWALNKVYDQKVMCSGPLPTGTKADSVEVHIVFDYAEDGLVAGKDGLKEFELAGEDGVFHPASARIEDNEVIVTAPEVIVPTAVRYAWGDGATATLFNQAWLPATSFELVVE